ncbi:MAG: DUF4173 domain-containing protein [Clostridia bacterium]|nr:DUF4173 domain-containing protein [Clostridia bacterium]
MNREPEEIRPADPAAQNGQPAPGEAQSAPNAQTPPPYGAPSPRPPYAPYHPGYTVAMPAPKTAPVRRDRVFFHLLFVVNFFFFEFAYTHKMRLGLTVYFIALFAVTAFYLLPGRKAAPFPLLCGGLGVLLSCGFSVSAEPSVSFLTFAMVELLYLIFAGGVSGTLFHGSDTAALLLDTSAIFFVRPFEEAGALFRRSRAAGEEKDPDAKKLLKTLLYLTVGVMLAVPVLVIVFPLLMRADGAFSGLIERIAENFPSSVGRVLLHLLLAFALLPFTAGMLFSQRYPHKKAKTDDGFAPARGVEPAITCGFLGLLSVVYLTYLFSQLAYFFDGFSGLLPEGFETNAEYARRGFFEMCGISAIDLVALFVALSTMKRQGRAARAAGALAVFVDLFSLVLIGTALSKMILYVKNYDLSVLRLLTSVFMTVLAVAFLLMLIRVFFRRFAYMRIFTVFCACVLTALLFGNVRGFVADYNAARYLSGERETVDVSYLRELGVSAAPALERLVREAPDPEVKYQATSAVRALPEKEGGVFSYTRERSRAARIREALIGENEKR